jgi:hypothetical protein
MGALICKMKPMDLRMLHKFTEAEEIYIEADYLDEQFPVLG